MAKTKVKFLITPESVKQMVSSISNLNSTYPYKEPEPFHVTKKDKELISNVIGNDLFKSMRSPLCLGAILGLIPIRGLMSSETGAQQFSWLHWRSLLTLSLTILIGINTVLIGHGFLLVLSDTKRQSAGELVGIASGIWFYAAGMIVYLFFFCKSKKLCKYFYTWKSISEKINNTMEGDYNVERDINIISFIVLSSCFGENLMFHFNIMTTEELDRITEFSLEEILKIYYNFNAYMLTFFNYHPLIALFHLILNKLTLYAWNFGDVILMLLSRAIYGQFERLNKYIENQFVKDGSIEMIRRGVEWKSVRHNFLQIYELLQEATHIFSPLIWLSYATDIFFVCNQLYIELTPSRTHWTVKPIGSIYIIWSFLHLIMRTLAVSIIAAKINDSAHRLIHLLQHCYPDEYTTDVRRLELFLGSRVIGLTGNDCFVITRSFILMIISAIFTLEVVLLQNSNLGVV